MLIDQGVNDNVCFNYIRILFLSDFFSYQFDKRKFSN